MTPEGMPTPRSHGPSIEQIHTLTMAKFNHAMESSAQESAQESVVVELTQRLAEREAQIRSITQQKMQLEHGLEGYLQNHQRQADNQHKAAEAYDTLLSYYAQREEELRVATETNRELDNKRKELEKLVRELQNNSNHQRLKLQQKEEKLARLTKVERESELLRVAIMEADGMIKKKEGVIDYLNQEMEDMITKSKESEKTASKIKNELKDELSSYQSLLENSKSLAEEQINVLLQNEETIGSLEDRNTELQDVFEGLNQQLIEDAHTIESKDILLNMQRQEMGDNEALVKMYETKFEAKNTDVHAIVARADKGERLWSRIEEREKKFAAKEIMLCAFRDENTSLQSEKKRLHAEVAELKQCFEMYDLKLSGTNDKVHMPWLLSQLRDSVALKERAIELEEIIRCEGYTIKAAEAEIAYQKKEMEMTLEMEKISQIIDTLKGQTAEVEDIEVPVLLGKLEEALIVFGHDHDEDGKPIDDGSQIVSAASSDIMSLNTNNSYMNDKWSDSRCINIRDFKDLMHPDHYAIMTSLAEGFGSFSANQDDDEDEEEEEEEEGADFEDRDDIVDGRPSADGDCDKADPPAAYEHEACREDSQLAVHIPDLHIEKVLKILQLDEDPDDWRKWFTPPHSPCSAKATTE
eukprot:CAMPEP_0201935426 /NCGR_PEP_ID=MMETSP0903-20130614/35418_1 /ASSEMBLY_ACC=CAM_ASM_000552 /TAXON_ID=420261 /ORGANISM="Thalassiosira antarctica, Strain CCMP982" /LENGTH=638 /DNA_ID=CAMNT_0048475841 /DNA_START=90 /DNA_END=2006 /DNA_ORIENTATION=+